MFNDTDVLEVWYGEGWELDENKDIMLGIGDYYQGANKFVFDYLDKIKFDSYYIRWIGPFEDGRMVLDYGSHSKFFKLRKVR